MSSILMITKPIITEKSWLDLYWECGITAPFLGLSALGYLWLFYVCLLWVVRKQSSFHFQLLLPSALLPVIIGIFGSAMVSYKALNSVQSPYACEPVLHIAELLLPLIAGSFLSACFICMSLVILYINGHAQAKQRL